MGIAKIVGILLIAAGALGAAWVPARTSIDAQAVALPAQAELTVRAERRCPHCGVIESKWEILAFIDGAGPLAAPAATGNQRD